MASKWFIYKFIGQIASTNTNDNNILKLESSESSDITLSDSLRESFYVVQNFMNKWNLIDSVY